MKSMCFVDKLLIRIKIMKKYIIITSLLMALFSQFTYAQTNPNSQASNQNENWNTAQILTAISELKSDASVAREDIFNKIKQIRTLYQNLIIDETDIQFFELNRFIAESRTELEVLLDKALIDMDPFNRQIVEELNAAVTDYLNQMLIDFENFSGVSFDAQDSIQELNTTISSFSDRVLEIRSVIDEADAHLLYLDSDGDGLSDYDEIFIYNTDPNNPNTAGGELNDLEKVMAGLDPTQAEPTPIDFEDPREEREDIQITDVYTVNDVMLDETKEKVIMSGRALPNSVVTLYVFSAPIVVKVKTDGFGHWTYTFDQELETGEHRVYVATVNNSGNIVAQSNAIPFVRTAEAASLMTQQITNEAEANFLQRNLQLIIGSLLLISIIITIALFGKNPAKR